MIKLAMQGVGNVNAEHMVKVSNLQQDAVQMDPENEPEEQAEVLALRTFSAVQRDGLLAPMTSASASMGGWEKVRAIVGPGASVPAFHPSMGKAYPLHESVASRGGVVYEFANDATLPNHGEKLMAVMTKGHAAWHEGLVPPTSRLRSAQSGPW